MTKKYDVVVIGAGPGGEGAAMQLAKGGKKVGAVDGLPEVGGNCTHKGTIPSKALRHAIQRLVEFNSNPLMRKRRDPGVTVSFAELLKQADSVIDQQVRVRSNFYFRNAVDLHVGHAEFLDEHTLRVSHAGGPPTMVTAEHFVLAMGSRPYRPPNIDFNHPRVVDSDTLLELQDTPHTITIYGAGVIGCEYASIFSAMGIKVNLINSQERLLNFMDSEVSDALTYHLREQGVVVMHNETYTSVDAQSHEVVVSLKSGKKVRSAMLLWANGRAGNTDAMNLETAGLTPNSRGQLEVNEHYQTAVPHMYAVGDIVGYPGLASAAYDQGRYAARRILDAANHSELLQDMPTGIYTIPEISSVGKTEEELTKESIPYEVGFAPFKELARSQMTGQTTGMLKLIFHRETLAILGIHCFGDRASEIVHIGQAIMRQKGEANTIRYFIETTFNYPTMAEAYRVAALSGMNRLC